MLKKFYRDALSLFRRHLNGPIGVYFNDGEEDYLSIWKIRSGSYTIIFYSAAGEFKSWSRHDVPLKEVILAIKSYDGGTDMFGNPFHNNKTHDFEY